MELTQISDNYFLFQAKAPADLTIFNQTDDVSRGIIRFGLNNNFPQEIIKSVQTSPIANSCVETLILIVIVVHAPLSDLYLICKGFVPWIESLSILTVYSILT